ncbi:MAG: hypothetical protein C0424_12075 [Sphingobacteriaceae bacterium]|nr:hypothetical protein [Sphingobacteriaceae bacterium]
MPATFWDFGFFTLYEPVTVLTDLLVTAVCWRAAWLLRKQAHSSLQRLFMGYFWMMGLATAYGGIIGHGFIVQLGFAWKVPGWLISMLAVALLERAAIFHAGTQLPARWAKALAWLNVTELLTLTVVVLASLNFFFVEAHAAYGLLGVVGSLETWLWYRHRAKGSLALLQAVGIAALAAGVHLFEISPHTWFNHLDLSHCLMAWAAWQFYRGAREVMVES